MRAQIRGLDQASRNAQDAISFVQTAEGGLSTINEMIIRMRELTVQAANDINTGNANTPAGTDLNTTNRSRIQNEINHLIAEVARTANTLQFNGMTLLDGSFHVNTETINIVVTDGTGATGTIVVGGTGTAAWFQIGANSSQGINVAIPNIANAVASVLNNVSVFNAGLTITSGPITVPNQTTTGAIVTGSGQAISYILDSIDNVLGVATAARGALGAIQNRLEFTIQNLDISSENLQAANSRIRDADMAAEMMRLTQANVLQQAATAMLAQGNQAPQSILQLLG